MEFGIVYWARPHPGIPSAALPGFARYRMKEILLAPISPLDILFPPPYSGLSGDSSASRPSIAPPREFWIPPKMQIRQKSHAGRVIPRSQEDRRGLRHAQLLKLLRCLQSNNEAMQKRKFLHTDGSYRSRFLSYHPSLPGDFTFGRPSVQTGCSIASNIKCRYLDLQYR